MTKDADSDATLDALIRAERAAGDPASAVRLRVRARLAKSGALTPSPSASVPASSAGLFWVKAVLLLTIVLLSGAALLGRSSDRTPSSNAPPPEPSAHPPVDGPAKEDARPVEPPPAATGRNTARRKGVKAQPKRGGLDEENTLIGAARRALEVGRVAEAERLIGRHRSEFPAGLLSEERDALWIIVLANSGRRSAALEEEVRFARRFPESIHRAALEAAIKTAIDAPAAKASEGEERP